MMRKTQNMSTFNLTEQQEKRLVSAIEKAEQKTSGELRVHIEANANQDPMKRATAVFSMLGMDQTELRNGVLFTSQPFKDPLWS